MGSLERVRKHNRFLLILTNSPNNKEMVGFPKQRKDDACMGTTDGGKDAIYSSSKSLKYVCCVCEACGKYSEGKRRCLGKEGSRREMDCDTQ